MMLYAGEKIYYSDRRYPELEGDGTSVIAGGERRLLSRVVPANPPPALFAKSFAESFDIFPESEWDARIDEQIKLKARVSDYCDFPAYDQNGLPTCWANGPCQAFTILRRMMGLPHKQISACSVAVPISGGHSGGWEQDALDYLTKYGGVGVDLWPNNSTDRSKMNDAACQEDRKNHIAGEVYTLKTKAEWVTAALMGFPGAFAYNRMSHVMCSCDVVRTEAGHYAFRQRNSWSDSWGAKNDLGQGGFNVWDWVPDSGFCIRTINASVK